VNTDIEFGN